MMNNHETMREQTKMRYFMAVLALYHSVAAAPLPMLSSSANDESSTRATNLLEPKISFSKALRPRNDNQAIQQQPRQEERRLEQNKAQSTSSICHDILGTMFAHDRRSQQTCTCHANSETEYLLECDYSSHCGSFCADTTTGGGPYDCFDRLDRYIMHVTAETFVNTMYEGCGTYVTESTRVCLMELRDFEGTLSERCLEVDGRPCQCHRGSCGDFVFQCNANPAGIGGKSVSPWESFILDECNDLESYGYIPAGQVHGLLSSNVFSLDKCFAQEASVATKAGDYVYCSGYACPPTPVPTNTPTTPRPTQLPTTKKPSLRPTKEPTRLPTVSPTNGPTVRQTGSPTFVPTASQTADTTRVARPTVSPIAVQTASPTLNSTSSTGIASPPTMVSTTSLSPSDTPSAVPSTIDTSVQTVPQPTASPTVSSVPTVKTVDFSLEPFKLVFGLFENHTDWHPPSMIRAVQQVLVSSLRQDNAAFGIHDYSSSLHDFRLECTWVDSRNLFDERTDTSLECNGLATLRVIDNDTSATQRDFIHAQAVILLQGSYNLSILLSNQLGESVEVLDVEMDVTSLNSEDTRERTPPPSRATGGPLCHSHVLASVIVWNLVAGLLHIFF